MVACLHGITSLFHAQPGSSLSLMSQSREEGVEHTWGDIGLFTGPHHISFLDASSSTILLSKGDRPVFAPEKAVNAPVDVMADPDS